MIESASPLPQSTSAKEPKGLRKIGRAACPARDARVMPVGTRFATDLDMPESERPTQVYAAAAANLVIAVSKLIAAAVTGSSAMFSEGIHSTADTGNHTKEFVASNIRDQYRTHFGISSFSQLPPPAKALQCTSHSGS